MITFFLDYNLERVGIRVGLLSVFCKDEGKVLFMDILTIDGLVDG